MRLSVVMGSTDGVGSGRTNPLRSRSFHQEETTFRRRPQEWGNLVVKSVCRDRADGLCQFGLALASWCAGSAIKRPCEPVPVTYAPGAHGPDAKRQVRRCAARLPARPRPAPLVAT